MSCTSKTTSTGLSGRCKPKTAQFPCIDAGEKEESWYIIRPDQLDGLPAGQGFNLVGTSRLARKPRIL